MDGKVEAKMNLLNSSTINIKKKLLGFPLPVCCANVHVDRTWSGPSWSPALSLSSLLMSIQSLMSEKPYHNEPGFELVIQFFQHSKQTLFEIH